MKDEYGRDNLAIAWPLSLVLGWMSRSMFTDNYLKENAWTINNQCGTGFTLNSSPYSFKSNLQSTEIWLPSGEYYFTITDTSKNGLCCASGQGWYEIIVDGITVHTGLQTLILHPNTIDQHPSTN